MNISSDTYMSDDVLLVMQISEIEKPLFKFRTSIVLSLSIIADVLDFVGGPILGIPPIGDIPNAIITGILYILTGSKKSAAINSIKFIPFIGDFIPVYTLSSLMWFYMESRKRMVIKTEHLQV
jgi:hypothetical protein